MLDLLRGKRLVFVGDSLNRNMWESLICILRNAVKDKRKVYEANGRAHFRGEASYSFIFKVSVEIFCACFFIFNLVFGYSSLTVLVWYQWHGRIITSRLSFLYPHS